MSEYEVHFPTIMSVSQALDVAGEDAATAGSAAERGAQDAGAACGGGSLASALSSLADALRYRVAGGVSGAVGGAGERLASNALRYSTDDAAAAAALRNTFTDAPR